MTSFPRHLFDHYRLPFTVYRISVGLPRPPPPVRQSYYYWGRRPPLGSTSTDGTGTTVDRLGEHRLLHELLRTCGVTTDWQWVV